MWDNQIKLIKSKEFASLYLFAISYFGIINTDNEKKKCIASRICVSDSEPKKMWLEGKSQAKIIVQFSSGPNQHFVGSMQRKEKK